MVGRKAEGSISSGRGSVVFDLRGAQDFEELHEDPGAGGPSQHRARCRARTQDDGAEPEVSLGGENLTQVSISLEVAGFFPFQMPGVDVAHARVPAQIDLRLPGDDTVHVRVVALAQVGDHQTGGCRGAETGEQPGSKHSVCPIPDDSLHGVQS